MIKANAYSILGAILIILLISCKEQEGNLGDFKILPSPQQFDISGISNLSASSVQTYFDQGKIGLPVLGENLKKITSEGNEKNAQIIFNIDSVKNERVEGYRMVISKNQIEISARDKAGLLYGFMTLEQLLEDAKDQNVNLPTCSIIDYPLLSYRAIHVDVKHHTEKKEYYFQLMDRLAKYKINGVIAEVEDKIKFVRQPKIGSADALTISEWKELSDYAKERNIEISPLVQGLGHASFILKHEEYAALRDDPHSDWAFNPLDPKTYEVQFDLYSDALDALPHGKYLHIGGDEVHTTGRESGKSALELQLYWLDKVCKYAEENGRIPIFWDDMPLKHAGVYRPMFDRNIKPAKVDSIWEANEHELVKFIDQFPKNCIYMRWNYQTPETYGNLKAMDWFTTNGFQVMGATAGQTRWTLMPQEVSNYESIKSFALSSIDKNLDGLLLTLWDDDSPHFELYMRGIMTFAEYTWAGDKRSKDDFKKTHEQRAFGLSLDSTLAFIDQLEGPVGSWKNFLLKDKKRRNNLQKLRDPVEEASIDLPVNRPKGEWSEKYKERIEKAKSGVARCDSISTKIREAKRLGKRNIHTLDVYEQVNELVKYSFETILLLESLDLAKNDKEEATALEKIGELGGTFVNLRANFEEVYGKTRVLEKPDDYILDQDHHTHSANQSRNFDWQFVGELYLLENLKRNGLIRDTKEFSTFN